MAGPCEKALPPQARPDAGHQAKQPSSGSDSRANSCSFPSSSPASAKSRYVHGSRDTEWSSCNARTFYTTGYNPCRGRKEPGDEPVAITQSVINPNSQAVKQCIANTSISATCLPCEEPGAAAAELPQAPFTWIYAIRQGPFPQGIILASELHLWSSSAAKLTNSPLRRSSASASYITSIHTNLAWYARYTSSINTNFAWYARLVYLAFHTSLQNYRH